MMLIFHHLFTLTGWVLAIGIFRLRMQTYFWLTRWSEKGQHEIRLRLHAKDYFSPCFFLDYGNQCHNCRNFHNFH